MGTLFKHDFGVAPTYLMRGRNAREQCVLLYLWQLALAGDSWTFKKLGELAGCTINRAMLDKLVEEGHLEKVPESERETSKPCHEYIISANVIPNREKAPAKPVKQPTYSGWVWTAIKTWKAYRGDIGPKMMSRALAMSVSVHGPRVVLEALERYAKRSDPKFNPAPEKFAANIMDWIKVRPLPTRGQSMLDLVGSGGE